MKKEKILNKIKQAIQPTNFWYGKVLSYHRWDPDAWWKATLTWISASDNICIEHVMKWDIDKWIRENSKELAKWKISLFDAMVLMYRDVWEHLNRPIDERPKKALKTVLSLIEKAWALKNT